MNDFERLNAKIEQSPKLSKGFAIFTKILSICIIVMCVPICFVSPVFGIIGILFGIFIFKIAGKSSNFTAENQEDINTFEFPETDAQGHSILKIFDMNVTGVMHEHDGVDPQTVIPKLYEGEQVLLEADPENPYDEYAVKVKTTNGLQIGWLPQGEGLQIDVANRLNSGQTVYARIKKGYLLEAYPGKVGLVIDVARYSTR